MDKLTKEISLAICGMAHAVVIFSHVAVILWVMSAACGDGGDDGGGDVPCGMEVVLPPPYAISGAAAQLELGGEAITGHGGAECQLSVGGDGRELLCNGCWEGEGGAGVVNVTLTLTDGSTSFPASVRVPVAVCAGLEVMATCDRDSTQQRLLVSVGAGVMLLVGGSEGPLEGVVGLAERESGNSANLVFYPPISASMDSSLCRPGQYASIQVLTTLLTPEGTQGSFPGVVKQSIPFDVCSCVKQAATSHIPALISVAWSSDSAMHNSPRQQQGGNKPIHAAVHNEIHDLGGTSAQQRRTKGLISARSWVREQANGMQVGRVRRRAANQIQATGVRWLTNQMQTSVQSRARRQSEGFDMAEFTATVAENVAVSTVVITLRAMASEGTALMYNMRSSDRNSDRLFEIDSGTGVVRTEGKQGGREGGACEEGMQGGRKEGSRGGGGKERTKGRGGGM